MLTFTKHEIHHAHKYPNLYSHTYLHDNTTLGARKQPPSSFKHIYIYICLKDEGVYICLKDEGVCFRAPSVVLCLKDEGVCFRAPSFVLSCK